MGTGFMGIFFLPNGTDEAFESGFAPFAELYNQSDFNVQIGKFDIPRWIDWFDTFFTDPNIAQNVQDASRLVTADVLLKNTSQLVDLMKEYPAGLNFSKQYNFTYHFIC